MVHFLQMFFHSARRQQWAAHQAVHRPQSAVPQATPQPRLVVLRTVHKQLVEVETEIQQLMQISPDITCG